MTKNQSRLFHLFILLGTIYLLSGCKHDDNVTDPKLVRVDSIVISACDSVIVVNSISLCVRK